MSLQSTSMLSVNPNSLRRGRNPHRSNRFIARYTLSADDLYMFMVYENGKDFLRWDINESNRYIVCPAQLYLFPKTWIQKRYANTKPVTHSISHFDALCSSIPIQKYQPQLLIYLGEDEIADCKREERKKLFVTKYIGLDLIPKYENSLVEDIPSKMFKYGIVKHPQWRLAYAASLPEEMVKTIAMSHAYSSHWNELLVPTPDGWYTDIYIPIPVNLFKKSDAKIFKVITHIRTGDLPTIAKLEEDEEEMFNAIIYPEDMKSQNDTLLEENKIRLMRIETMTVSHLKRVNEMDKNIPFEHKPARERLADYFESLEKEKKASRKL